MKYFKFLIFILALLLLVGCAPDESDRVFEDVLQQRSDLNAQEDDIAEVPSAEDVGAGEEDTTETEGVPDEPSFVSDLYGTLTMINDRWDSHTSTLANRFMQLHPGVEIIIEEMDLHDSHWFGDLAEQTALITRLLANPPDIFSSAVFTSEKANFEQLFIDLNTFLDGPDGVNREDYFDNILRAAEVNGSLYSVPLMIDFNLSMTLLNKRYFEAIGVPIDEMRTITLPEFLEFHERASRMFPDDNVGLSSRFHMFDVFRFERVHDVSTGIVNADTPEMREILEYINSVRLGSDVNFSPETVIGGISGMFGVDQVDRSYTNQRTTYMYHGTVPRWVFFMQDHPTMQFSHPVHRVTRDGDIMFEASSSLSIMRGSENQELAWEFIRFCMEYSDSLFEVHPEFPMIRGDYFAFTTYPVNRQLFNAQYREVLNFSHRALAGRSWGLLNEENREAQVEYAMSRFIELIEMVNAQCRFDRQAMNSIIYPDLFQFHLGNQDVYATLRSIQNRLEIYVAE